MDGPSGAKRDGTVVTGGHADVGPLRLLLLCEANVCRSPAAAALLTRRLRESGAERYAVVRSAGVRTEAGLPVHPHAVAALRSVGIRVGDGKRSARLTVRMAEEADVLLAATTAVRDAAILAAPAARDRAFSWLELLALVPDPPLVLPGSTPRERWVELLRSARQERGLVPSAEGQFDVPDPIALPRQDFDQMVVDLDASMTAIARLVSRAVRS